MGSSLIENFPVVAPNFGQPHYIANWGLASLALYTKAAATATGNAVVTGVT